MLTALVWPDASSFRQHLDDMRIFRQSHPSNLKGSFTSLKNMPTSYDVNLPSKTGGTGGFISVRGKPVLVPIWEIELPRNSQN